MRCAFVYDWRNTDSEIPSEWVGLRELAGSYEIPEAIDIIPPLLVCTFNLNYVCHRCESDSSQRRSYRMCFNEKFLRWLDRRPIFNTLIAPQTPAIEEALGVFRKTCPVAVPWLVIRYSPDYGLEMPRYANARPPATLGFLLDCPQNPKILFNLLSNEQLRSAVRNRSHDEAIRAIELFNQKIEKPVRQFYQPSGFRYSL